MIIEINKPFPLYRCDTELPPNKWTESHALKTNYGTKYGDKGPKNKAGLFFFHDNKDVSNSYGIESLKKINKDLDEENHLEYYYITETDIIKPIKIIDFSKCHSMFMMIDLLMQNGINILTSEFTNHHNNITFDNFLVDYNNYLDTGDSLNALRMVLINGDVPAEYSYFGQLIYDFENGIALKKILEEKNIDGYRWREHNDPRGLTYCLLNSTKLQEPSVSKIEVTL